MGKSVRNYLILVFLALIWGSSFILMKRGLEVFDVEITTIYHTLGFVIIKSPSFTT